MSSVMTNTPPHDARAVANLLLDVADAERLRVSNLTLQKLLYFAHGTCLIEDGIPLMTGVFEGWRYGPVHTAAYSTFSMARRAPIRFRATCVDIVTGNLRTLPKITDRLTVFHVMKVLRAYGKAAPGLLIEIAHARGGPWDIVTRSGANIGERIEDDLIAARFGRHWRPVGLTIRKEVPHEEALPSVPNRPRKHRPGSGGDCAPTSSTN